MKKSWVIALSAPLLTFFLSVTVPAWDDVGHQITAYIAWQRMSPDVRDRVITILRSASEDSQLATFYISFNSRSDEADKRDFFMIAATWADMIRDRKFETRYRKYNHSNWHYSDTFWTTKNGRVETVEAPGDGGQALERIVEFIKLQRSEANDAQKAIGIAWLEHLIGDIHQPLHTSARVTELEPKGDLGGNLFLITPAGTPRDKQDNLHSFWDSIIVRTSPNVRDAGDSEYILPIAKRVMRRHPFVRLQSKLALNEPDQWKKESFEIASTRLYPPSLRRNASPSPNYKRMALTIAEERMALAGYRMGELFNQLFGAPK